MNDFPLGYWIVGLVFLLLALGAAAAITHLLVALMRAQDLKEFWYRKYSDEHQVLEKYRAAVRKGEFNA